MNEDNKTPTDQPTYYTLAGPRQGHPYHSTACTHSLHDKCRLTCKYCENPCICDCHGTPKCDLCQATEQPLHTYTGDFPGTYCDECADK